MSRFWNPRLAALSPYTPGEQPEIDGLIKLNTNELPCGPSPRVAEAVRRAAGDELRLYPDPQSRALRETWGGVVGLPPGRVFVGNGSDEVLAHTFKALFQPGQPLLYPDISYSFYPVYADFFELEAQAVALDDGFNIDFSALTRDNGGIIFPNPNAPTGIYAPLQAIASLLESTPDTVVVVDEAYIDFGGDSAVDLIDAFPNLLVIQTLSKSRALAGLRVGAAFGQEALIEGLQRVKNSFNCYPIGRLAEAGAIAALEDETWTRSAVQTVIASREKLARRLTDLGFEVLPSAANFLFVRHPQRPGAELYLALRERNVLVRYWDQPRISDFFRISVGTERDCEALVAALERIL